MEWMITYGGDRTANTKRKEFGLFRSSSTVYVSSRRLTGVRFFISNKYESKAIQIFLDRGPNASSLHREQSWCRFGNVYNLSELQTWPWWRIAWHSVAKTSVSQVMVITKSMCAVLMSSKRAKSYMLIAL